ncbi:imidazoleglycerol-phosphate dehydratase [Oxobacter pfennigii]|uniref:Imidazoleglycerol-phosphate dehydratase n=1 Tax=Oxobacter pfennigii TaxID=36849 RepID=A0A0P8W8F8_9CLOT|nr:imidazoleglycerol-phosphate dehydratase HisB [Oxobacter pfennigii]KPU44966.1 imidazoleglycerol-phosphate dehydratase [Oxobacter pfennigii]
MRRRCKSIERKTKETDISIEIAVEGSGNIEVDTGIGFFDHMLISFLTHGNFDGNIKVSGDKHVDYHHSVEDTGIVLGMAFAGAIEDKNGIKRFGTYFVPMDEALAMASVDISGRPYLVFDCNFPAQKIGDMDTELFIEFFRAFAFNFGITLHIKLMYGSNSHHIAEAVFKAAARAIRKALTLDSSIDAIPSTKGVL